MRFMMCSFLLLVFPKRYPFPTLEVDFDSCYRLRVINMATDTQAFQIGIAGHNLTVISLDGEDIHPLIVGSFSLFSGERLDAILCANQTVGRYLITVA